MSPPAHQPCLDTLKRCCAHLDEKALGSANVRQYIPQPELNLLMDRLKELKTQYGVLDWTTAFPTVYNKKTVKNYITKATLPGKCRALEKAVERWRKDAEHVRAAADRKYQSAKEERLERFRREHPGQRFNKHLASGGLSPTTSEYSVPRWEARSSTGSTQNLPIEDLLHPAAFPWIVTDVDSSSSSLPSPGLSSRRSTLSEVKKPAPWLTRNVSGNFGDNAVVTETFRVRTISTTH
ncbi:hypothetical protein EUX98_g4918 [Antrodiella citrinella]|uniref:Uncharacterized protein n=1 Tax=Antrodiella citrinella TaxID=2447956 RepID=A0A4V6S1U6_9APHY|nr:hypothetical protein EUX98_g4918 [Antrodiella citrinella]